MRRRKHLEQQHLEVPVAADSGLSSCNMTVLVDDLLLFLLLLGRWRGYYLRGDNLLGDMREDDELAPRARPVLSKQVGLPADHPFHVLDGLERVLVGPGRQAAQDAGSGLVVEGVCHE